METIVEARFASLQPFFAGESVELAESVSRAQSTSRQHAQLRHGKMEMALSRHLARFQLDLAQLDESVSLFKLVLAVHDELLHRNTSSSRAMDAQL